MWKKIIFACALATFSAPAFADCLQDDPTRVKSDAANAMNNSLDTKDKRGLSIPLVGVRNVSCHNQTNFNPFGASLVNCHANLSGKSGASSYSISCSSQFKNCGTPTAKCSLSITQ